MNGKPQKKARNFTGRRSNRRRWQTLHINPTRSNTDTYCKTATTRSQTLNLRALQSYPGNSKTQTLALTWSRKKTPSIFLALKLIWIIRQQRWEHCLEISQSRELTVSCKTSDFQSQDFSITCDCINTINTNNKFSITISLLCLPPILFVKLMLRFGPKAVLRSTEELQRSLQAKFLKSQWSPKNVAGLPDKQRSQTPG